MARKSLCRDAVNENDESEIKRMKLQNSQQQQIDRLAGQLASVLTTIHLKELDPVNLEHGNEEFRKSISEYVELAERLDRLREESNQPGKHAEAECLQKDTPNSADNVRLEKTE